MSKGDGHGMSFVYDWQLFTEKIVNILILLANQNAKHILLKIMQKDAYIISKKIVVAH